MKMPRCCEKEMSSVYETSKFMEAHCGICGDVVYVKKEAVQKPELLDD
jgi:transcription elongation factor Elf1